MDPEKLSAQTEYNFAHAFLPVPSRKGLSVAPIGKEQTNYILTVRDVAQYTKNKPKAREAKSF
jgi:hypothetical protein